VQALFHACQAGNGYTFPMKRYALRTLVLLLCSSLFLAACGNKGPLVKPEPEKTEAGAAQ
jgi:predicted small lipoprotein YifL